MKFILGRKQDMTQVFDEVGNATPVTLIVAKPLTTTQVKSSARDGYEAVQLSNGQTRREFRARQTGVQLPSLGSTVDVSVFSRGDLVTVSGVSKGKGFQGVVKRHGFAGGPRTHGQKHSEREPGSIGGGLRTRVPKGMRMAGRMGGDRITVKNLRVVAVNAESGEIAVRGAIPGRRGTLLEIRGE